MNSLRQHLKIANISRVADYSNKYQVAVKHQRSIHLAKTFLALLTIAFMFSACTNDPSYEMSSRNENYSFLKVGDKEIRLKSGSLENLGSFKENVSDFVLNLFSSDFKMNDGKPEFNDDLISGISIDLYADSLSDLQETSYNKVSYENISKNSFQALDIAVDYNFENGEGITRQVTDGSLKVYNTGSNYELEFTGIDNKGEKITFFYEGKLSKQ